MQVSAIPSAIQAMPLPKLQLALTKSIASLKARDRTIDTLRSQLQASASCTPPLPTSFTPTAEPGSTALAVQKRANDAEHRATAAEARARAADAEVAQMVRASKGAAEASAVQLQEMAGELAMLKRKAAELADSKVCQETTSPLMPLVASLSWSQPRIYRGPSKAP